MPRLLYSFAGVLLLAALGLLHSTGWGAAFGQAPEGARLARLRASPAYVDGRFHNLGPGWVTPAGNVGEALKSMWRGAPDRQPPQPLPQRARDEILRTLGTPPASGLRVTWLGHSTLLVEIDGRRLLTDPMFSDRSFPSTLVGPKRFQPPALAIDDLPPLDGVLLSHDHYDHLDRASIVALNRRGVTFYAPLGVGAHLEHWGVPANRIVEHDRWQRTPCGDLTLIATPAHHFSGRLPNGANPTLWCSWVIAGPQHRVFFSGDSGLAGFFTDIGNRHGPFDLACMDIGASDPSWADIHFGPKHALTAAGMLRARRVLPIHWGTFNLALHAWNGPVDTLVTLAEQQGMPVLTPILGDPIEPAAPPPNRRWWHELTGP